jgi:PAS domain S-box-containing protein
MNDVDHRLGLETMPGPLTWALRSIERVGILSGTVLGAVLLTLFINFVVVLSHLLLGTPGYAERPFGGLLFFIVPIIVGVVVFFPFVVVIDRLRRAELAAEYHAEKFQALADGSIQGICIQRHFMPLYCNRAYAEMFGFDSVEHVYRHGSQADLVPKAIREGEADRLRPDAPGELLPAGTVFAAHRLDGSEIWVEATVQTIDWYRGQAVQITVVNVDERRRVEEIKNEFVSTVSHELRTPLTAIHGSLSLIEGGMAGEVSGEAMKLVRIASSNSGRLVRLINDILDLGRIESGGAPPQLMPLNGHAVARQAIEAITAIAQQRGVEVELLREDGEALILGDRDQLIQVLTNLLSNALRFSPVPGRVRVAVRRAAGFVRFEVSDDGPGIPIEFRPRVFQRFSRADGGPTTSGTGLGLSIAKQLVERHGGTIGFVSEPPAATTFYFDLPARRAETTTAKIVAFPGRIASSG